MFFYDRLGWVQVKDISGMQVEQGLRAVTVHVGLNVGILDQLIISQDGDLLIRNLLLLLLSLVFFRESAIFKVNERRILQKARSHSNPTSFRMLSRQRARLCLWYSLFKSSCTLNWRSLVVWFNSSSWNSSLCEGWFSWAKGNLSIRSALPRLRPLES